MVSVWSVISAFNEQGFVALDQEWSGGRPRRFGPVVREVICRVAETPPRQLGRPFTTWKRPRTTRPHPDRRSATSSDRPSAATARLAATGQNVSATLPLDAVRQVCLN